MPQFPYREPRIGPAPPPRIGPDPRPPEDETAIDRASLDVLRRLGSQMPWGEGGSASGSPYDMGRARAAAGVTGQVGGDIELPSGQMGHDIELPQEREPYPSQPTPVKFGPSTTSPEQAVRGLSHVGPMVAQGVSSPAGAAQTFTGGSRANEPLDLMAFRNLIAGGDDLSTRSALSDPGSRIQGLGGRTDVTAGEMAADPFTGEQAQAQQTREDALYRQAYLGGFRSPQEAEEAARQAATYKADAPVRAQEAAGRADIEKQRMAGESARDVANIQQSGIQSRYEALQDMLQGGGIGNIRSMNPQSGAFSLTPERQIPNAIQQEVTSAREAVAKAREGVHLGGIIGGPGLRVAQGQLDAAISSALAASPASPDVKSFIQHVFSGPQADETGQSVDYADLPFDQVVDPSEWSPQELAQIQNLLIMFRGR